MSKKEQDPFNAFNWDEEIAEVDFFGEIEKNVQTVKEEEEEKPVETEDTKDDPKKTVEKEEDDDEGVFEDLEVVEDEDEEEDLENDDVDSEKSTTNIKDSVQHLIDQGLLELDEGEELPENVDNDFLANKIETSIEKRFEESIQDLPEEVKNIIKYVHNGGNLKDIISVASESSELNEDIDLTNEANQEKVMKYLLKEDGEDDEIIEANIEFLKDSGKLSSVVEKKFNKWKAAKEEETQKLVKQQEKQRKLARENQVKFKKDIGEYLSESEEIKGLTISRKEAKELPNYISDTTVVMEDGRKITPFYRDLFEALRDKDKIIAIAKLVRSDFDFSDVKKSIVTKQTRELKKDLQRQGNKSPEKRSSQKKVRLIDLI